MRVGDSHNGGNQKGCRQTVTKFGWLLKPEAKVRLAHRAEEQVDLLILQEKRL